MKEDTIAAIASAMGEGGIGIIRISGEDTLEVLNRVFCSGTGGGKTETERVEGRERWAERRLVYGHVTDKESGEVIDEALAVYMAAPKTYTREDVAEIYCHGSVVSLRRTLALVLRNGARLAEPGEFTKRAFLNGRLDLSQAEAVIDLIKAKSEKSFDVAMSQLSGKLSQRINEIREKLMDILVDVTVNIDYPDEDIEEITYKGLTERLSQIDDNIEKLLLGAQTGRIIKEGLRIAIIGKPNVGKSSLMNALLGENRAIVTEIPGTTRDTIEETLTIKNIPVILTDTAGIRKTGDAIEKIGIEKSKESFNKADLIIFMVDGSDSLSSDDREIMEVIGGRKTIVLLNKRDKGELVTKEDIEKELTGAEVIETSVSLGNGLNRIEEKLEELVYGGKIRPDESMLVTSVRHSNLLEKALSAVRDAILITEEKEPLDIIEIDIRTAYDLLGEITGETAADDIIDEVFARFCLGK